MDQFVINDLLSNKTMDQPIYRSAEQRLNKSKNDRIEYLEEIEYQETEPWKTMIRVQEDFEFNRPGLFEKCVSMKENYIVDFATDFATE